MLTLRMYSSSLSLTFCSAVVVSAQNHLVYKQIFERSSLFDLDFWIIHPLSRTFIFKSFICCFYFLNFLFFRCSGSKNCGEFKKKKRRNVAHISLYGAGHTFLYLSFERNMKFFWKNITYQGAELRKGDTVDAMYSIYYLDLNRVV